MIDHKHSPLFNAQPALAALWSYSPGATSEEVTMDALLSWAQQPGVVVCVVFAATILTVVSLKGKRGSEMPLFASLVVLLLAVWIAIAVPGALAAVLR